jgi:penicillin-binding protein 1A
MVKAEYLPEAEAQAMMQKPIVLDYHKLDNHEGLAPYFRQIVEQEVKKICKELEKPDGTEYNLYKDGLKIYTTIDLKMQEYAEAAVEEHISTIQKLFTAQRAYREGTVWKKYEKYLIESIKATERYEILKERGMSHSQVMAELSKPIKMRVFAWNKDQAYKDTVMSPIDSIKYMKMHLQAGFMAMDPFTGEVKAWVGGINHTYFQYDHVNINTKRQVGSTIKPLLYCLAVDNGFSPCGTVSTMPQSFPEKANYDAGGSEYVSVPMQKALALSINNAALYIIKQVGVNAFVDFLRKCGITTPLEKFPSLALGAQDISLYEMVSSYTMFPNGGIHVQPYFITKIEDKKGALLKTFAPVHKEVINDKTAFKMVKMMQGVIDHGTGRRMRGRYAMRGDIAGKTGTTNSQADAWFIGYTPQILAGAWVGCDDRYLRFASQDLGQGSAAALPIWAIFMQKVYKDKALEISTDIKFKQPEGFDDCDVLDPTSVSRSSTYTSSGVSPTDSTGRPIKEDEEPIEVVPQEEW